MRNKTIAICHLPGTAHKPQDISAVITHSHSYLLNYNKHRKAIRAGHGLRNIKDWTVDTTLDMPKVYKSTKKTTSCLPSGFYCCEIKQATLCVLTICSFAHYCWFWNPNISTEMSGSCIDGHKWFNAKMCFWEQISPSNIGGLQAEYNDVRHSLEFRLCLHEQFSVSCCSFFRVSIPLYFAIKIQRLSRTLKLHFEGPILEGSLQHGQYYSNIQYLFLWLRDSFSW